jgi:uncharacterized protein (TIGR02217 family)
MFFDCEFPRQIGFTSLGGSSFNTYINEGFSGFEQRNRNWSQSKGKWQILLNGKPQSYFEQVYNFYLNVGGMADAFRFYWPIDNTATGQLLGTPVGEAGSPPDDPVYQLIKTYVTGSRTYTRTIKKPIDDTIQDFQGNSLTNTINIYDNGVLKTRGTHYTQDATTGLITFLYTPTVGHLITSDFQFHIPVRFDVDDMLNAQILDSDVESGNGLYDWSQIKLIEERM